MLKKFICLFFIIVMVSNYVYCDEVVFIVNYGRHGARNGRTIFPNKTIPAEANLEKDEIQPNGIRMTYILGKELRQRYPELFTNPAKPFGLRNMSIIASQDSRTQISATSLGIGLLGGENYAYTGFQESNVEGWKPPFSLIDVTAPTGEVVPKNYPVVALKSVQYSNSDLFISEGNKNSCPGLVKETTETGKDIASKYSSLVIPSVSDVLNSNGYSPSSFGKSEWDFNTISWVQSDSECKEYFYGAPPANIPAATYQRMKKVHFYQYALEYTPEKINKALSDPMAREILAALENRVNNAESDQVFKNYLGHDSGLMAHQIRFNINSADCLGLEVDGEEHRQCDDTPGFASSFIYELHYMNYQYFVRVLWNGRSVPFCSESYKDNMCKWDTFKDTYSKAFFVDPKEFESICQNPSLEQYYDRNKEGYRKIQEFPWYFYFVPIAAISILLGLVIWRIIVISQESKSKYAETNPQQSDRSPILDRKATGGDEDI